MHTLHSPIHSLHRALPKTKCINLCHEYINYKQIYNTLLQFVVKNCTFMTDVHNLFIITPLSNFALHGILRMIFYARGKHCPRAE